MAMKCTRCGTLLVPGSVSCPGCGQQFATPVPQDPAPPQAAPSPTAPPPYGAPPAYGTPPQPGPAPQYGTPPPQYGTPPPYGANQPYGAPPPYGQAPKKAVPVWVWIGLVVVLGIAGELSNIGKNIHNPPTPAPAPGSTPTPSPSSSPTPAPTTTPAPVTGDGDVNALADNMTKFGEALQEFGAINGKPQFDDPAWRQRMEQNIQRIKDNIAEEKQIVWPARFMPAKENYEGGLAGVPVPRRPLG